MHVELHNSDPVSIYSDKDLRREAMRAVRYKAKEDGKRVRFTGYKLRVYKDRVALVGRGVMRDGQEIECNQLI